MGVTNMDLVANNPDQDPQIAALYGSYYFWGLKDPYSTTNNTQKVVQSERGIVEQIMHP